MKINVKLCSSSVDLIECFDWIQSSDCGGIDIFIGTVRNNTKGREVLCLEFEAYETMAITEMEKIANEAFSKFEIEKVLIFHALGSLKIGEIPVIIAVAAKHRAAAFEACRFSIDKLKETVPIWKKEIFADGESWVSAHP